MKQFFTFFSVKLIFFVVFKAIGIVVFSYLALAHYLLAQGNPDSISVSASFTSSQMVVDEGRGIIKIPVSLSRSLTVDSAIIRFKAQSITATCLPGQDYELLTHSLVFYKGDSIKEVWVQIIDDVLLEAEELFFIGMDSAINAKIGAIDKINVVIRDNDLPSWSFAYSEVNVLENARQLNLTLKAQLIREGGAITIQTKAGTALPLKDFIPIDTTIVFTPFSSPSFSINIPIIDNALYEDTLSFDCVITEVSAGYIIGYPSRVRVNIIDNDFKPNAQFRVNCNPLDIRCLADTTILEVTGNFENTLDLEVRLSYPWQENIEVAYQTKAGIAQEGINFLPLRGSLIFQPGDTLKQIRVPIINNRNPDPEIMNFYVLLSDITPNAQLGFYDKFTVTLLDNDPVGRPASFSRNAIQVYPNPATSFVYIESKTNEIDASQISLINLMGQKLKVAKFENEGARIILHLPTLEKGIYYIKIENSQLNAIPSFYPVAIH
jgi:hypothetical protein